MTESTDLKGREGVEKLKDMVEDIRVCLFGTDIIANQGATNRPMTAQEVDFEGNLWFFSGKSSDLNHEIEKNVHVQLCFSDVSKGSYLVVNGDAQVVHNQVKIDELWSPLVEVWFKEGKTDPNVSLIKVNTQQANYWDSEGNRMVNFVKLMVSAVTGKNTIESKHGTVKVLHSK
jgi:general stress protein 26